MIELLPPLPEPTLDDGGLLQIKVWSDRCFSAVLPGPDDMLPYMVEWTTDLLNYPPDTPGGEIKFYERRFTFIAIEEWVIPRFRWFHLLLRPWTFGQRPYIDYWPADDAAAYFEACWLDEWFGLIPPDEPKSQQLQQTQQLLIAAPTPAVQLKAGKRGLHDMAREMGIEAEELETRIRVGTYNIIVTERVGADGDFQHSQAEGYKGTWYQRCDYFFSKADAQHNVTHGHEPGRIQIRKDR